MRKAYMDFAEGNENTINPHHVYHCFDALRQDLMCNADDTPMAMHDFPNKIGNGQVRMCRDWAKLDQWAQQNTACFGYVNETEGVHNEKQRYKFCPKDSIFAPNVRKYFGLPEDWFEEGKEQVPHY